MKVTAQEVKVFCKLVNDYCNDRITREEFWALHDKLFPQLKLF